MGVRQTNQHEAIKTIGKFPDKIINPTAEDANDFLQKIKSEISPANGWRTTTYKRKNGSIFYVSIPPSDIFADGKFTETAYNELAEMKTALRLNKAV